MLTAVVGLGVGRGRWGKGSKAGPPVPDFSRVKQPTFVNHDTPDTGLSTAQISSLKLHHSPGEDRYYYFLLFHRWGTGRLRKGRKLESRSLTIIQSKDSGRVLEVPASHSDRRWDSLLG